MEHDVARWPRGYWERKSNRGLGNVVDFLKRQKAIRGHHELDVVALRTVPNLEAQLPAYRGRVSVKPQRTRKPVHRPGDRKRSRCRAYLYAILIALFLTVRCTQGCPRGHVRGHDARGPTKHIIGVRYAGVVTPVQPIQPVIARVPIVHESCQT